MPDKSKIEQKMDIRIKRPTTIAGAFGGLFEIFGHRASVSDLSERWDKIMGNDIAKIATLVAIKQMPGNKYSVVIKPRNPALALELSYSKNDILCRINKYFGYDAISKITIRK